MPRCAKVDNRTRTRATRFGITAGLPVPVPNPNCPSLALDLSSLVDHTSLPNCYTSYNNTLSMAPPKVPVPDPVTFDLEQLLLILRPKKFS